MYQPASRQERSHKNFFYPQETMGTTIIAVKYDGGVIACADSRKEHTIQAHQPEESTLSIESRTKSTMFTNISSH
jgi:20S proteasome alpha/beta subunit